MVLLILTIDGKELSKATNEEIWEYKVTDPRNPKKKYALINLKGVNEKDDPIELTDVPGTVDQLTIYDKPKGKNGFKRLY